MIDLPPRSTGRAPWWRGTRGEWFVVLQGALVGLVFFGPRGRGVASAWPAAVAWGAHMLSVPLMVLGSGVLITACLGLGRSLTPLPFPKEGSSLVQTGLYGIVRHPIYSGGLVLAIGWAMRVQSWFTLGYVFLLFLFFDLKSRREEAWLTQRFPEYADYRRRVRKLIPFLY